MESEDQPPMADVEASMADAKARYAISDKEGKLLAQCHCGQVRFYVDRPDNGGKWKGTVCVCRSCRLALGQTFVPFLANVPFAKIIWSDGSVFDDSAHHSITRYQSSEKAHRDFCSRCGASVLWSGQQPQGTVDIAAGLLRAEEGVLAKSWLVWGTAPFNFAEDAVDKDLVSICESNLSKLGCA